MAAFKPMRFGSTRISRWACFTATWSNCRRETRGYRWRTSVLAWQERVIAGPEPTWSM